MEKGKALNCTKRRWKNEISFSANKVTKVSATTILESEEETKSY